METGAAVEIDKGGLRRFLIDDFHNCLKKACAKPLRLFSQFRTGPATIKLTIGDRKTKTRSTS